jgi:hypothetical protein
MYVAAVTEVLENWVNTFEDSYVCICTATTSTLDIKTDLINVNIKGEHVHAHFKPNMPESDPH